MRSLQQCLLDTNLTRLRVIARFWDVEVTMNRQRDVATHLAEVMATPQAIASAYDALPDQQRQPLEALLAAGGRMPTRVFARQWGEIRPMGPGRMEREQPWQEPASPAEGLWYKGFIYRAFEQGAQGTYEVTFVPAELHAHLPIPSALPSGATLEPAPGPTAMRSASDALLDDACTLLSYLQNEQLRLNPSGDWPPHHEVQMARRLHDADPERLAFLRHLAGNLGWLRVTDTGRLRPNPGPATAWLQSSAAEQRRALADVWRDDPTWNDLFHVPTLRPQDTGAWRNDPLVARKVVLHQLKACKPEVWYALDDFVATIKQTDPDFQRPDGDYTTWYIRDAATGDYLLGFESWDKVEGEIIRYLITGPLAWLGVTNLGSVAPDKPPNTFCITPAGAAWLGLAAPADEPEPARVALRPDFSLLVPPARRYDRFQLARVADWASSPPAVGTGGRNALFVYRLTPTSLERARRQGIPVARVLEFLGQVSSAPVPRFIEAALTRWENRGVEVRLERAVLIRVSSEELMSQVISSPCTRHFIRDQLGPTSALVRERDWPRLVAALGELGLLADVTTLDSAVDNCDQMA